MSRTLHGGRRCTTEPIWSAKHTISRYLFLGVKLKLLNSNYSATTPKKLRTLTAYMEDKNVTTTARYFTNSCHFSLRLLAMYCSESHCIVCAVCVSFTSLHSVAALIKVLPAVRSHHRLVLARNTARTDCCVNTSSGGSRNALCCRTVLSHCAVAWRCRLIIGSL